jgi:hypothetical protein
MVKIIWIHRQNDFYLSIQSKGIIYSPNSKKDLGVERGPSPSLPLGLKECHSHIPSTLVPNSLSTA